MWQFHRASHIFPCSCHLFLSSWCNISWKAPAQLSSFTFHKCQGASEHDINISLFLYSCTVQPSLLSEVLTLHIAFWIMKSSCHASQVDCEVIWALCSRTKRYTRLHKILFFTYWNMLFRQSDVLSLFLNVIHETDSSESKFSKILK